MIPRSNQAALKNKLVAHLTWLSAISFLAPALISSSEVWSAQAVEYIEIGSVILAVSPLPVPEEELSNNEKRFFTTPPSNSVYGAHFEQLYAGCPANQ